MNYNEKKMINKKMAIMLLFILLAISAGSMTAFAAPEKLAIELQEWTETDGVRSEWEPVSGIAPGMSIPKILEVRNTGNVKAEVVVQKKVTITLADGTQGDSACISFDIDLENWEETEEGYRYRQGLKPGETTAPLFTTVILDPYMNNEYANSRIEIQVRATAVSDVMAGEKSVKSTMVLTNPKTGDSARVIIWSMLFLGTANLFIGIWLRKRNK